MKNWDTSSVTEDEVLKVKCACVHGTCDDGESTCAKCYAGWRGRMCDIATTAGGLLDKWKKAIVIE
jgi:hypothetical protein